jgi:uncharacterized protein involved in cysteine biosynthesis
MITGILSLGVAIAIGVKISTISYNLLSKLNSVKEVLLRIVLGTTVFVMVSTITAWIAAFWQDYPLSPSIF